MPNMWLKCGTTNISAIFDFLEHRCKAACSTVIQDVQDGKGKKKCGSHIFTKQHRNVLCHISVISQPIVVKFCRLLLLTQLNDLDQKKTSQTKLNQTIVHIKLNFSQITHRIFMKFCMVFQKTRWHINMQSFG